MLMATIVVYICYVRTEVGVLLDCCRVPYSKAAVLHSLRFATMPILLMGCHSEECISRWGRIVLCSVRYGVDGGAGGTGTS